jgi:hypothetical protein
LFWEYKRVDLKNIRRSPAMLRKILLCALALVLLPTFAFATYTVVLKDGTRYKAKEKWRVSAGKAIITLENGTTMSLDPKLIDEAESERVSASGLGGAKVLVTSQATPPPAQQQSPLGSITTLRRPEAQTDNRSSGQAGQVTIGQTNLSNDVLQRFQQAYENVGLYDAKVLGAGTNTLRVELTADNEDQVFKAISATSFLMTKIPDSTSERVEIVELFMKTTTGGSAGRFQMSAASAAAITNKQITWQDYFIREVIF